jgi:hypothetical protein
MRSATRRFSYTNPAHWATPSARLGLRPMGKRVQKHKTTLGWRRLERSLRAKPLPMTKSADMIDKRISRSRRTWR